MRQVANNPDVSDASGAPPPLTHEHEHVEARAVHLESHNDSDDNHCLHSHDHATVLQDTSAAATAVPCGCCSRPRSAQVERARALEVQEIRERWLANALRDIDMAEEAEEAALPVLDALPAAEDFMEVVVANVSDWPSLVRLRSAAKWLSVLVTRFMERDGMRAGPRSRDFDERGVLHLLGSFHRTPWSFGQVTQRVRVFASDGAQSAPPLDRSSGDTCTSAVASIFACPAHANVPVSFNNDVGFVLDRTPRRVFLNHGEGVSCVGEWIALDLGPHVRVTPEALTLRHSSRQGRALRSFRLDGANAARRPAIVPRPAAARRSTAAPAVAEAPELDPTEWVALLTVERDARLGVHEHASASWQVGMLGEGRGARGEPPPAYRYFRVVKTGPDAVGDDFLHLSGIELYGRVRLVPSTAAAGAEEGERVDSAG